MGWWTWGPMTGALIRRVPADVLNLSSGGCLLKSAAPLVPGLVGVLELQVFGRSPRDAVRICHASSRPGSALPYCAGAEFLIFDAADSSSIRDQVARDRTPELSSPLARAGENSGMSHTTPKAYSHRQHEEWTATSGDHREI